MSRMTLSERARIEAGIYGKLSLKEIAKSIHKSPRHVSEEIRRNRTPVRGEHKERRTRVYYCDPQASWQKPHLEKNHEYIRYVLPKGRSFNPYTQEDILLLQNHINSTRRQQLGGRTPFELADSEAFRELKKVLGLEAIPADEVNLTPRLLKKA